MTFNKYLENVLKHSTSRKSLTPAVYVHIDVICDNIDIFIDDRLTATSML
jgi:hypothetical protein